jgi:hypothetical protein
MHMSSKPAEAAETNATALTVEIVVTGGASDTEDAEVPGVYELDVHLSRAVNSSALPPGDAGAIAEEVLDEFHDRQGIKVLDDFEILLRIKFGAELQELENRNQHATDLVQSVSHSGKTYGYLSVRNTLEDHHG